MFGHIHRKRVIVAGIVALGLFHGTPLRASENDSISDTAIQESITTLEEKLAESDTAADKQKLSKAIEALRNLTKPSPATVTDKHEAGDAEETSEAKLPVPDDDSQKKATAIVKDVFKADYDKAKSQSQKLELAKKLLQEGEQTHDDPTGKFVLLRIARDLAIQVGDVSVTMQAIDQIVASYNVDSLEMKSDELAKLAKSIAGRHVQRELIEAIESLTDAAVDKEKYPIAQQLAGLAITVSRNTKDAALLKSAVARSKEVDRNAAAYAETQKALKVLEDKPTDPDANLVVGKFRCFSKNDWENGLPLLALSNDGALKDLAEKDIHGATEPAKQLALGDGWWDLSEKETGASKAHLRHRAEHWYREALPNLSGLPKSKAEKRLAEIAAATNPTPKVASPKAALSKSTKPKAKPTKPAAFTFNDENAIKQWWSLTGDWRLQNGGIKFLDKGGSLTGQFTIKGDAFVRVKHIREGWTDIHVTAWGQKFTVVESGGFSIEKRRNQVVFCEDGKTPEIVTLKMEEAPRFAETTVFMSVNGGGGHTITEVAIQGDVEVSTPKVATSVEVAPDPIAAASPKAAANPKKVKAKGKAKTFTFSDEKTVKQSWMLKGDWRLQNGGIKFTGNGSLTGRFTIRGDGIVTVKHAWGGGNYSYLIDVTIWGQKFNVFVPSGRCTVEKRGGQVTFCEEGKTPEVVTLKEEEALRTETGLFIYVAGGNAVAEVEIQGDINLPQPVTEETTWEMTIGDGRRFSVVLLPSGDFNKIDNKSDGGKWTFDGVDITLEWASGAVDRCVISADRRSFEGKGGNNVSVAGKLLDGPAWPTSQPEKGKTTQKSP